MKSITHSPKGLILFLSVIILTGILSPILLFAQSTTTKKCQVFSVKVPATWTNDTKERSGVYSSISSWNYATNQRIEIGAFYLKKDPAAFLKEQIGNTSGSPFLRNADSRKIESFTKIDNI